MGSKKLPLESSETSWLVWREAGVEARRVGGGANRGCLEAGTSNFAVAAAIRARRASMLASAAKRSSSSVGLARAALGTILEGIIVKEQVRCCQRSVRRRGFAVSGSYKVRMVNVKADEEEGGNESKSRSLYSPPLGGKQDKVKWQSRLDVIPFRAEKGDKFTLSTVAHLKSAKIEPKMECATTRIKAAKDLGKEGTTIPLRKRKLTRIT